MVDLRVSSTPPKWQEIREMRVLVVNSTQRPFAPFLGDLSTCEFSCDKILGFSLQAILPLQHSHFANFLPPRWEGACGTCLWEGVSGGTLGFDGSPGESVSLGTTAHAEGNHP